MHSARYNIKAKDSVPTQRKGNLHSSTDKPFALNTGLCFKSIFTQMDALGLALIGIPCLSEH